MNRTLRFIASFTLSVGFLTANQTAQAWSGETHRRLAQDALAYMGSSYATSDMQRAYNLYVGSAGGLAAAQKTLGQASVDVDAFLDTALCGWWVFGCHTKADDLTLGLADNNYTSWWHFINMSRGADIHGNDRGGYNYQYRTDDPSVVDYDWAVATFLWNQELSKDHYNTTEAHYRQGSYSTWSQYGDFQTIPWQPVDNLGKYWYDQFKASATLQRIGYALHAAGDVGVAQHALSTISNYHPEYESWVDANYATKGLASFSRAASYMPQYNVKADIRSILTQTATRAAQLSQVLRDKSDATRTTVAQEMVARSLVTNVLVLTKAANYLYGQE